MSSYSKSPQQRSPINSHTSLASSQSYYFMFFPKYITLASQSLPQGSLSNSTPLWLRFQVYRGSQLINNIKQPQSIEVKTKIQKCQICFYVKNFSYDKQFDFKLKILRKLQANPLLQQYAYEVEELVGDVNLDIRKYVQQFQKFSGNRFEEVGEFVGSSNKQGDGNLGYNYKIGYIIFTDSTRHGLQKVVKQYKNSQQYENLDTQAQISTTNQPHQLKSQTQNIAATKFSFTPSRKTQQQQTPISIKNNENLIRQQNVYKQQKQDQNYKAFTKPQELQQNTQIVKKPYIQVKPQYYQPEPYSSQHQYTQKQTQQQVKVPQPQPQQEYKIELHMKQSQDSYQQQVRQLQQQQQQQQWQQPERQKNQQLIYSYKQQQKQPHSQERYQQKQKQIQQQPAQRQIQEKLQPLDIEHHLQDINVADRGMGNDGVGETGNKNNSGTNYNQNYIGKDWNQHQNDVVGSKQQILQIQDMSQKQPQQSSHRQQPSQYSINLPMVTPMNQSKHYSRTKDYYQPISKDLEAKQYEKALKEQLLSNEYRASLKSSRTQDNIMTEVKSQIEEDAGNKSKQNSIIKENRLGVQKQQQQGQISLLDSKSAKNSKNAKSSHPANPFSNLQPTLHRKNSLKSQKSQKSEKSFKNNNLGNNINNNSQQQILYSTTRQFDLAKQENQLAAMKEKQLEKERQEREAKVYISIKMILLILVICAVGLFFGMKRGGIFGGGSGKGHKSVKGVSKNKGKANVKEVKSQKVNKIKANTNAKNSKSQQKLQKADKQITKSQTKTETKTEAKSKSKSKSQSNTNTNKNSNKSSKSKKKQL